MSPKKDLPGFDLRDVETLRSFVENISEGVYITTPEGALLDCNRALIQMFGAESLDQLRELRIIDLLVDTDLRDEEQRLLRERGWVHDFEFRIRRLDGAVLTVLDTCFAVRDASGRVVANHGVLRDISERKASESDLQRTNETLRSLIEASPLGILVMDFDGQVEYWNPALERMFGWTAEEVMRRSDFPGPAIPEDRRSESAALRQQVLRGEAVVGVQTRRLGKDGVPRDVSLSAAPLRDADGDVRAMVMFVEDIGERLRLEERLLESQKMDSIGRLAAGIAHDFNNLLTAITGYAALLRMRAGGRADLESDVLEIHRAADRAAQLVQQLLAFGRKQARQPTILDLNEVVAETEKLLGRLIREDIELRIEAAHDLVPIEADHGQVQQVIINLAVNARDAMPNGGTLTIGTANVDVDEAFARTHPDAEPGSWVVLTARDSGEGMDRETLRHVFDPFFTTKEVGEGTGLGLSTVYGIVKQSGGFVLVDSAPGEGTEFRVYLPQAEASAARSADDAHSAAQEVHNRVAESARENLHEQRSGDTRA